MSVAYDQMLEISEQIPVSRNRRLKILEQNEIDEIYGLPRFSDDEREQYFALTSLEMATLDELHSVKSKIVFILQLGYFKARSMFFLFDSMDVAIDMQYITERYFPYTKEQLHGYKSYTFETSAADFFAMPIQTL